MANVPSAVLRQREKLERELGMTETPSTPAAAPETPAVPEEVPPTPTTDAAALQRRIAELEHLLRTRDGQTSTAQREANEATERLSTLSAQVDMLQGNIQELTKRAETAEALAQAKRADGDLPPLDDPDEISEKEMQEFGPDSIGFVKKLSKRELLAYVRPLVQKVAAMEKSLARLSDLDKLPQLEKAVQNTESQAQRMREEEFFRTEVLAYFDDFEKVRQTDEWKAYLTSDIPGRGIKVGHLLQQYRLSHDASGIRSVLQRFYDAREEKPSLAALAVPAKTQTEGTPVVKPKMKASDYRARLRAFTSKQLPRDQWLAYKTEFETALAEGRVDMDERI